MPKPATSDQRFDLAHILRRYEEVRTKEQRKQWDLEWETRLVKLMNDLHEANYSPSASTSKHVASAYVELLSAMQELQARSAD
jgi:hypothetical protein